jgi:microcystin-dependent protein
MEAYIGSISLFAFNWAPRGYALCSGTLLPISQNTALFPLIGDTFGGDARTTFVLPDLRGRAPVSMGQGPGTEFRRWGEYFGMDYATLTSLDLPAHQHAIQEIQAGQTVAASSSATVNASDAQADRPNPNGNYWAKPYSGSSVTPSYTSSSDVTMASDAVQVATSASFTASNLTTGSTGGSQSFSINPPSLALNYAICMLGYFPPCT